MVDAAVISAAFAFLLVVAVLTALFLGIYPSSTAGQTGQPTTKHEADDEAKPVVATGRRDARSRMQARRRREEAAASESRANQPRDADDTGSESGEDEEEEGERLPRNKKDRNKEEKRAEREARRAAQEAKEQKVSAYDEKRRTKQEKLEATRRAQEEEMQRAEAERNKKEEEEAAQWMGMISVEQEGTGEGDDMEESQGLLAQFVDYIKQRKTVPLEQLATEFKLRTTDVIDRVQGLEAMGRLTGVMDERGKYIYISIEEMQAVASYITSKGRVAISELAAKSNTFIDLDAKATAAGSGAQPAIDFDSLLGDEAAS